MLRKRLPDGSKIKRQIILLFNLYLFKKKNWGGGGGGHGLGYPFKSTAGYDLMNDYTLKAYNPTQTRLTNVVMTCNPTTTLTIAQCIYYCCGGFFCTPLP